MNLETLNSGWLIACGFALLVFLINIGLFSLVKKKNRQRGVTIYTNMLDTIRSPWKNEEKSLAELDQAVRKIRSDTEHEQSDTRSKNE